MRTLISTCLVLCVFGSSVAFAQDEPPPPPASPAPAAAPDAKTVALEKALRDSKEKADTDKKEADEELSKLKNGTLMSSGVTGGVALALQYKGPSAWGEAQQRSLDATTMPYILFLPAYWGTPQATREACASSWAGGEAEALAAARAVTAKSAATNFDSIVTAFEAHGDQTPATQAAIITELRLADSRYASNAATVIARVAQYVPLADDQKVAQKKVIVAWMSDLEYRPALQPWCWPKRFGIWLGRPLPYTVRTRVINSDDSPDVSSDATADREVRPILAFGGAFSPNKYATLLLGLTVGHVTRDATPTAKEVKNDIVWATTIGFGGNLDILTRWAK